MERMSATSEGLGGGSRLGGGRFVVEVIKVEVRFNVVAMVVVGVCLRLRVHKTDEKVAQPKSSRGFIPSQTDLPRAQGKKKVPGEREENKFVDCLSFSFIPGICWCIALLLLVNRWHG